MELKTIIPPETDIRNLELSDLINVEDTQCMMDNFYKIARIPMAIIDMKGKILVGVGWQDICTKFHRVNGETYRNCIESDLKLTADIPKGEFRLYKCRNGMWDMATPIFIGDQCIGNLFIGQFFFKDEKVDYQHFVDQSARYNFNKTEYLAALRKVPFLSKEDIENAKVFFLRLADSLSQLSYSNIKLARSVEETRILTDSLRRSEERFFTTLASIGDAVIATDLKGDITFMNPVAEELTGLSSPQAVSRPISEVLNLINGLTRETVENPVKRVLESGTRVDLDKNILLVKGDGNEVPVDDSGSPIKDREGNIIGVVLVLRDITYRTKAEKELKGSKEKLNIALDIGNIGIWEWDLLTDEIIFDERMEKMFGIEPATFKGTFNDFENMLNEEDLPHFKQLVSKALHEDVPFETIFRIREKNCDSIYINTKAMVEKDSSGRLLKMTGVCFDITEMKRGAEQVLFKLNEELLRSNRALEQFAYVASHDLQEPLRMVSSFSQLLSQKYSDKLDEDAQEYIRFSVEGAERMFNMINGLLAYSRIQTRAKEFKEVDMNYVMEQVLKNLSFQIQASNASVTYGKLPVLKGDANQMIQLLQNLVSNAVKFSTGNPEVHISCERVSGKNIFSVTDKGIGIDPHYFDKIFKIFQRLVSREEYPGTGIGLAICKIIVERHGGKIWVESVPDKGSTFYFAVPE
jgi:PAS domain S-box-containing protein